MYGISEVVTTLYGAIPQIHDLKEELSEVKSQSPTSVAAVEGSKEEEEKEEGGAGAGQEKRGKEASEPGQKPAGWQTSVDAVAVEEKLEEQKSSLRWSLLQCLNHMLVVLATILHSLCACLVYVYTCHGSGQFGFLK